MKEKPLRGWSVAYVLATIVLVVLLGTATGGVREAWMALLRVQPFWLLVALGSWIAFLLLRTGAMMYYCARQELKLRFWPALRVTVLGQYYSGITPAATGGQPMQVYEMTKFGIPAGVGTSAVVVETLCFQIALMVLAALFWVVQRTAVNLHLMKAVWIIAVGYGANLLITVLIALMISRVSMIGWLVSKVILLGTKLRWVKDPDSLLTRINGQLEEFHRVIRYLIRRPVVLAVSMGFSALQVMAYMSIIYFLYRGFGWTVQPYGLLVAVQMLLYITASFMPTPGASGAQEGGFILFFRGIFPERSLFPALLVWRFFTYYLVLIFGAVAVVAGTLHPKRRPKAV
jgi:uncharacterized protein (TIRG00374 family)